MSTMEFILEIIKRFIHLMAMPKLPTLHLLRHWMMEYHVADDSPIVTAGMKNLHIILLVPRIQNTQ